MDQRDQKAADPTIYWMGKVIGDMRAQIEMMQERMVQQEETIQRQNKELQSKTKELQELRPEQLKDQAKAVANSK